jgi:hypothetical protein
LLQVFGTIAMIAGTLADGLTIAEQLARPGVVPLGFANRVEFETFANKIMRGLDEDYAGTEAAFQGSSVTGVRFRNGQAFDYLERSDFDIALAGEHIFDAVKALGLPLRSNPLRSAPLRPGNLGALGLDSLQSELSVLANREVKFMVFRDIGEALARSPSVAVP